MNITQNVGFTSVTAYGASTLTLNPSSIDPTNATTYGLLMKLTYIWGDNTSDSVNRKIVPPLSGTNGYPFQSDLGNPMNIPTSHLYYPGSYVVNVYGIYSKAYQPILVGTINLFVYLTSLINDNINHGYASRVHLLANRNWGTNNMKLFVLETVNPLGAFIMVRNPT